MGVRILHDSEHDQAVLYCSTTDWAFGPVFQDSDDGDHDAAERADAFMRWLASPAPKWASYEKESDVFATRFDPRELTAYSLATAYTDWLAQEATQYQRERLAHLTKHGEDDLEPEEITEIAALRAAIGTEGR